MNYEHYANLKSDPDYHLFMFYSVGPKGRLTKLIAYTPIESLPGTYNLGFGTLKIADDGEQYIDDSEVSNNGDRNKILATIALTAYTFIDKYPERKIYLKGTNVVRTRLYQMAINYAHAELSQRFRIFGNMVEEGGNYDFQRFVKGVNYTGFLIEQK
jgi:hypothetical protein